MNTERLQLKGLLAVKKESERTLEINIRAQIALLRMETNPYQPDPANYNAENIVIAAENLKKSVESLKACKEFIKKIEGDLE